MRTRALRDDRVVECWGDNTNGQAPANVPASQRRRFAHLRARRIVGYWLLMFFSNYQ
jgi:hypothetical protein